VSIHGVEVLTLVVKRYTLAVCARTRYYCRVFRRVLVISHEDDRFNLHAGETAWSYPWIVAQLSVARLPNIALIAIHQVHRKNITDVIVLTQAQIYEKSYGNYISPSQQHDESLSSDPPQY